MLDVMSFGDGLIAGGWIVERGRPQATVWTSADANTWSRVDTLPGRDGGRIFGIAAAGSVIVAVGDAPGDGGRRPAAWVSADGNDWRAIDSPAFTGDRMEAVIDLGDGSLAVGSACEPDGSCAPASWRSSDDGSSWERGPADPTLRGRMLDVAPAGDGTQGSVHAVAVGEAPDGRAAAWTSIDGLTWTPSEVASAKPLRAALVVEGGVLATGFEVPRLGRATTSAAASWAGESEGWTVSEDVIPGAMFDLVSGGPGVVAVGADPETRTVAVSVLPQ
jgi:hypothetical protein